LIIHLNKINEIKFKYLYKEFYKKIFEGCAEDDINILCTKAKETLEASGKFIFAGNGGSFAIAEHISAELTGRFLKDRPPIRSIVLGTNSASLTAIANDYGFEEVFLRELKCFLDPNDLVILMSTSGNSKNIINCLNYLEKINHKKVFLITGDSELNLSPHIIRISSPSKITARIQEFHLFLLHEMCSFIDSLF